MAGLKMTAQRKQYLKELRKQCTPLIINAIINVMNGQPLMDICRQFDFGPADEKLIINKYMELRRINE